MSTPRADPKMRVVPAADPLVELARLRRPTGPWLHLLDGAPSDARQLGWMLGQDGVVVRILRGHCVRTGYGLFDETAAALQLPGDPVEDWPALAALLTDMSWLPGSGHLLVVSRAALLLAAAALSELHGFVATVREVARGRAEEGDPVPFHVVLQDDSLGLAGLRARLDAVGARYDDLTGWDAEEPVADVAVSSRSGYQGGDPRPDEVDRAVVAALSTRDGVLAVRRSWEAFRGPDSAWVRVYAPELPDLAAAPKIVTAAAAAAASVGAVCLVVPLLADSRRRDPRQQALAAASAPIWPEPELPPEPPAVAAPHQGVPPQADPQPGVSPAAAPQPGVSPAAAPQPVVPPTAGRTPDVPEPRAALPDPAEMPATSTVDAAATADAGPGADPDSPRDDPAGRFELVAANLEWPFASGSIALDPVDAALIRYAGAAERLVGLFRAWVGDPAGGWVRVVMAYVGSGSISGVETERSTIVDVAQRSGAKRCCIEIVGLSDVGDVHRWLEERSVALWRANPATRRPSTATGDPELPAGPAESPPADPVPPASGPEPGRPPAGTTPPPPAPPAPATPAPPAPAAPAPPAPAAPAPPAPAAPAPPAPAPPAPAAPALPAGPAAPASPAGAGSNLPPDAAFEPGPGEEEAALTRLVSWATELPDVLGLVTAWTELGGQRTAVVGVVVSAETDQPAIRAQVAGVLGVLPVPYLVESFAPSRGLPPLHLRLYRGSTRLWTRKVERPPAAPSDVLQLDTTHHPLDHDISQVLDVSTTIDDEELGGFTLVGLDLNASVQRGAEAADERDDAVAAWIRDQPHALAVLRAVTPTSADPEMPVYSVLVDAAADRAAIRRGVAVVVAGTGAASCGVEVICPFERIGVFHVQLYGASLSLWKSDRPPPSTQDDPAAGDAAAGPAAAPSPAVPAAPAAAEATAGDQPAS